ncbi:MAG: LysR family transcriptional regulator [Polyangiales bacterium]
MHVAWDQIQTVEALVRAGTLEGAARELGLRHTTIARRMEALERALDTPLFVRGARWIPTDLARALAERAAPMHRGAAEVEALIERARHGRSERLTITTNDVLAPLLLRALARSTPRTIDLHVADAVDPLERGTVDLALRPSQEPLGSLRGRRLGRLRLAVVRARGGRDR